MTQSMMCLPCQQRDPRSIPITHVKKKKKKKKLSVIVTLETIALRETSTFLGLKNRYSSLLGEYQASEKVYHNIR